MHDTLGMVNPLGDLTYNNERREDSVHSPMCSIGEHEASVILELDWSFKFLFCSH